MKKLLALIIILIAQQLFSAVSFTQEPKLQFDENTSNWKASFAVSEYTDVEVAIVNFAAGTTIRHLAAGVLGDKAPLPFSKSSLTQELIWDGKDDLKHDVANKSGLSVRVRCGMGVKLDKIIGDNPYLFKGDVNPGFLGYSVAGIAVDNDGMVYVAATANNLGSIVVRQYDRQGIYQKTVFPIPSGMAKSDASAWGMIFSSDTKYSPFVHSLHMPQLTYTAISQSSAGCMLPRVTSTGDLVFWGGPRFKGRDQNTFPAIQHMSKSSKITFNAAALPLITSQATPKYWNVSTRQFFCYADDQEKYIYVSGLRDIYDDAGFFKNGQVYKVNVATGEIVSWLTIPNMTKDSVASGGSSFAADESAIHGITRDKKGHVFVCDRYHHKVSVYDTNANLLGSKKVLYPEMVEVNDATGEFYVMMRRQGNVSVAKFSGWEASDSLVWQYSNVLTEWFGVFNASKDQGGMAVDFTTDKPLIWLAYLNVKCFRDDGASATLVRDFSINKSDKVALSNLGYERIACDPRTETVYFTDTRSVLFKIEDWLNPKIVQCSTATGPLVTSGVAISPDNYLYTDPSSLDRSTITPVQRYTLDHIHAPAPYGNGSNLVPGTDIKNRYGWGVGEKGLAVSNTGEVAYMSFPTDMQTLIKTSSGKVFTPLDNSLGGIEYDTKGNIYFGLLARNSDHIKTPGFETDEGYNTSVGSVVKMSPDSGFTMTFDRWNMAGRTVTKALKVYPYGTGGFSGYGGACVCRSPRFDVDSYDRLFIPNAVTQKIAVVDNDGNKILEFGEYGNIDSRGEGSLVPGPQIPLIWASGVSTSDDYIYISDLINARILRVQKTFVKDNMPTLSTELYAAKRMLPNKIALNSWPTPFNVKCNISVMLPSAQRATLQVYHISGKVVKTIANSIMNGGLNNFVWNGTNDNNQRVSNGVYFYKLTTDNQTVLHKVILGR
ncbi:MAG: T9SS type A sorting domain-containing protein [Fibrobacteres bacterium]|nr:T9SS type A sorting domain-containing protein [Fibrobacterota bacterium]